MASRPHPIRRASWCVIAAAILCAVFAAPALAQGFMVKPMIMEVSAPAGKAIEVPLQIRNTAGSDVRVINIRLAELSQVDDGGWKLIETGSGEDVSRLRSSLAWTTLSQRQAAIAPLEPADVMVRLKVPSDARGAYFAAIIAETPLPEDPQGIVVRVRFLIPLIVQIEGRPVRQQVVLDDATMDYHDGSDGKRVTTTAALKVSNDGLTFSRIRGRLQIERQGEGRWRPVTQVELSERSIIPGVALELGSDLERRLPDGHYRMRGELFVDGRRVEPIEKELDFKGDPNVDALAYDTALLLKPDLVDMAVSPGATRTTVVRVENPGTDPVHVEIASNTPRGLVGVEMGEVRGIDLSAEPWTSIRPAAFTIRPGRWQNVRVISRVPKEGAQLPNYYADLVLHGTYKDGQSAGETRSTIHLANSAARSAPNGSIEQLALAESENPFHPIVQVRLANTGNVHVEPSVHAFLLNAKGGQVRTLTLSGEEGPLLPLGRRMFSGEMDIGGLEPGYYALRVDTELEPEHKITRQGVILLELERATDSEGKSVSVPRLTMTEAAQLPAAPQASTAEDGAEGDPEDHPESDAPLKSSAVQADDRQAD